MKIVAVSGWKRSGKDTVADYLVKKFNAERLAFADPLKEMVSNLFGLSLETINSPETKEKPLLHMPVRTHDNFSANNCDFLLGEFRFEDGQGPGPRNKLHPEGGLSQVEMISSWFGQLYWTPRALCIQLGSSMRSTDPDFWVKKAIQKTKEDGFYVISDARYRNEVESLKKHVKNVTTMRINRFDSCESTDPSERDLDNYEFDSFISNKGTIQELYSAVDREIHK